MQLIRFLCLLLSAFFLPVQAQVTPKATIISEINTSTASGLLGGTILTQMVNSYVDPSITNTFTTSQILPTISGHLGFTATTPTANTCAGFALGTGSTDVAGRVTYTSATTCSINFGTAFVSAPFCHITPGSAAATHFATTTTAVLSVTFGTAQTSFFYACFGA